MGRDQYCDCIEKKLPKKIKSSKELLVKDINLFTTTFDSYGSDDTPAVNKLETKLRRLGLKEYEIDLVIRRIVDNEKMSDIVSDQGWTSRGSANYFYQQTLKKLRKAFK